MSSGDAPMAWFVGGADRYGERTARLAAESSGAACRARGGACSRKCTARHFGGKRGKLLLHAGAAAARAHDLCDGVGVENQFIDRLVANVAGERVERHGG